MSTKPELVAIYRLEFYRKQKNWKLSSPRINKKPSKKSSEKENTLNVTYDVDSAEDKKEQSDPLNVAFVESDSDKPNQVSIGNKHLSLERQEPVNIWPKISIGEEENYDIPFEMHEKPKENWAQSRLKQLQIAANLSNAELTDDNGGSKECDEEGMEFRSWSDQCLEWHYCDGQMENNDAVMEPSGTNNIWSHGVGSDVVDSPSYLNLLSEAQNPGLVNDALWTSDQGEEGEECESWSVDSAGEFSRGADAAPHSSELDLTLPSCVATPDVSFASLARLSTPQLVRAARLHSRVLRRLLVESEQRQKLRNALSFSFEDIPTRDVEPHVTSQACSFTDRIVAGSHKQAESGGRGRGRGRLLDFERDRFF